MTYASPLATKRGWKEWSVFRDGDRKTQPVGTFTYRAPGKPGQGGGGDIGTGTLEWDHSGSQSRPAKAGDRGERVLGGGEATHAADRRQRV